MGRHPRQQNALGAHHLGIVIGIVTVTLMGTAIDGLNQAFIKSISALGADVFYVSRNNWWNNDSYDTWLKNAQRRPPIRLEEAEALAQPTDPGGRRRARQRMTAGP